jgi:hypothetical protein
MKTESSHLIIQPEEAIINQKDTAPCESCQRKNSNRRIVNAFFHWRHLSFQGRRKNIRRADDRSNPYVDRYESELFYVVIGIILLSSCDAFLTLKLLQHGAIELNTLMANLIATDIQRFVNFKLALTGLSVILLVIYKNFRLFGPFRVYHLIWFTLCGYAILILYELALLIRNLHGIF